MSDIFDVLADGTRRELLRSLRERAGEVSVGELVTELGISQPTVSKHLKVLRDHALVAVREEGQHRYYRLNAGPLAAVSEWLEPFGTRAEAVVTPLAHAGAAVEETGAAFAAWAGTEVGGRVGRAAAETAYGARSALEAAQEKLQGAQKRLAERLPRRWHES
jgi:ArsR family transcriptional regulator, arsenate/arsenite/antimonite-responsive transcriptional repressor